MRFGISALTIAATALLFVASALAQPDPAQVAKARAAVKELGAGLKNQLVTAIETGGPKHALGVCKTIAPALGADVGATSGMKVGRTALRVRNPANTPDPWERAVLEDFLAKVKAGADPGKLEHAEVITDETGARTFRYMKAIPMGTKPCLTCHGAPEPMLMSEIKHLYPADQATGFKPGDLRGAFTVTAPAQ